MVYELRDTRYYTREVPVYITNITKLIINRSFTGVLGRSIGPFYDPVCQARCVLHGI